MLEKGAIKNPKPLSEVLHLGLALLFFLVKVIHILALLGSWRTAGSFLCPAPPTGGQRRVRPMRGASHPPLLHAELCGTRLLPDSCGTTSFLSNLTSSASLLHLTRGQNSQQSTAQPQHCTRPSCPQHHSRPKGGCGHPFCLQVLESVLIVSHSVTIRVRLLGKNEHNPHFSPIQSDLCFYHIPSFSDSITAKLPFEMQHDSLIFPFLRLSSLY